MSNTTDQALKSAKRWWAQAGAEDIPEEHWEALNEAGLIRFCPRHKGWEGSPLFKEELGWEDNQYARDLYEWVRNRISHTLGEVMEMDDEDCEAGVVRVQRQVGEHVFRFSIRFWWEAEQAAIRSPLIIALNRRLEELRETCRRAA